MTELGSTYRCNLPPRHIWVIISRPADHEDRFLFVNLTTYNATCVDTACILQPPDYPPFLTHATTVAYSRSHIGNVTAIELLVREGKFSEMPPIPQATLNKIIVAARTTPELASSKKALLPIN
jgi:hypothetical protein